MKIASIMRLAFRLRFWEWTTHAYWPHPSNFRKWEKFNWIPRESDWYFIPKFNFYKTLYNVLTYETKAKAKYPPIIGFRNKVTITNCCCKSTSKEKSIMVVPFFITQFFQLRIMFDAKSGTLLHQSSKCVTR